MSRVIAALVAVASTFAAGSAFAQAQPYEQVEAPKTWRIDAGGGFVRGFSATGASTEEVNWTFWGSASYKDIVYANGLDGVGLNILKTDDLRVGVQLRPRFAAGEVPGLDDRPELGGDAAMYVYKRLPGNVVVGARYQQDVTGDDAGHVWTAQVGHQRVTPVGLLQVMGYGRAGDSDRLNRYLGVTQEQAAAAGIDAFQGKGGPSAAGAAALLSIPIGDRYGVGGFVNYEQRLGDARHSPLVDKDYIWRAGIVGVVRFNGM